jgi:hypothetical protein
MQRRDKVALVAGTTMGLWGGALGAFLVCTATWAATCRLVNQLDARYFELRLPAAAVSRDTGLLWLLAGRMDGGLRSAASNATSLCTGQ